MVKTIEELQHYVNHLEKYLFLLEFNLLLMVKKKGSGSESFLNIPLELTIL